MEDSDTAEVLVRFNSSTACSPKCSYESINSSQILKMSKSVVPELFIAELFKVFKKRIPNLQHTMVAKLHQKFDKWIPLKKSDRDFVADGDCFLLLPMHSADAFTDSDCVFDICMDMSMAVKDHVVPQNNEESLKEIMRNNKAVENRLAELENRAKNSDANIQKILVKLEELTTIKSNQQKIYKLIEEYFTEASSNASFYEKSEVQFGDSTTSNTEQLISKLATPNTEKHTINESLGATSATGSENGTITHQRIEKPLDNNEHSDEESVNEHTLNDEHESRSYEEAYTTMAKDVNHDYIRSTAENGDSDTVAASLRANSHIIKYSRADLIDICWYDPTSCSSNGNHALSSAQQNDNPNKHYTRCGKTENSPGKGDKPVYAWTNSSRSQTATALESKGFSVGRRNLSNLFASTSFPPEDIILTSNPEEPKETVSEFGRQSFVPEMKSSNNNSEEHRKASFAFGRQSSPQEDKSSKSNQEDLEKSLSTFGKTSFSPEKESPNNSVQLENMTSNGASEKQQNAPSAFGKTSRSPTEKSFNGDSNELQKMPSTFGRTAFPPENRSDNDPEERENIPYVFGRQSFPREGIISDNNPEEVKKTSSSFGRQSFPPEKSSSNNNSEEHQKTSYAFGRQSFSQEEKSSSRDSDKHKASSAFGRKSFSPRDNSSNRNLEAIEKTLSRTQRYTKPSGGSFEHNYRKSNASNKTDDPHVSFSRSSRGGFRRNDYGNAAPASANTPRTFGSSDVW